MRNSSMLRQIFAATSASLIFLCGGFQYAWFSSALPVLVQGNSYAAISSWQYFWMSSSLLAGGICGALFGLILVDTFGRRTTLLLMSAPLLISCVLFAVVQSWWLFSLARFLAGLAVGVAYMVTPMYIGEIADSKIRGGLCALMPVMLHIGDLIPSVIGPWVAITALAIVGTVIPIVFATALLWAPESPYYYAMKRIPKETRKSVAWLKGSPDVDQEVELIRNSMALNQRKALNYVNLFRVSSNRKAFFIVIGLLTCQQLSFTSTLSISLELCFYKLNISISYQLIVITLTLIQLVSSICALFLIDAVGRRPLLLISASICTVSSFVYALYFELQPIEWDGMIVPLIPTIAVFGCLICYPLGLGTLPHVVAGEIFPCEVKAFGLAIATAYYFALQFGISVLYFTISPYFRIYYLVYFTTAFNTVSTILIYIFLPETKGRSLSEIQIALHGHFKTQS